MPYPLICISLSAYEIDDCLSSMVFISVKICISLFFNVMAKIPYNQSRNTSRNYKSDRYMGENGPLDIPVWDQVPRRNKHLLLTGCTHRLPHFKCKNKKSKSACPN
jgi:hypothetical protein